MGKYKDEKENRLLKLYLTVLILLSIIELGNSFLDLIELPFVVDILIGIVIFAFSIYALIQFHRQKLSKLTYIIPIWIISVYVLFILLGVLSAFLFVYAGSSLRIIVDSQIFKYFDLYSNMFGLLFAAFLLYFFKKK